MKMWHLMVLLGSAFVLAYANYLAADAANDTWRSIRRYL